MKELNFISIQDLFWINWAPNRLSIRLKEMPENVHMTLSTSKKSELINVHLSKNNGNKPKPQLRILEFKKSIAHEILDIISKSLVSNLIEEIDVSNYVELGKESIFTKLEELGETKDTLIEGLIHAKNNEDKVSNKRIEIKGEFSKRVDDVIKHEPFLKEILDSTVEFTKAIENDDIGNGYIILKDGTMLLKIKGLWYKMNVTKDLLSKAVGLELFNKIYSIYKMYMEELPKIETFEEGMKISDPIKIIIQNNDSEH